MKKILSLFFVLVLASFTVLNKSITISGKILNAENKTIIIKGDSFYKEILLKNDGSFSEDIEINYNGAYVLLTPNNKIELYLADDSALKITADENNFDKTIKYSGNGSIENEYISNKNKFIASVSDESLYQLNEKEFVKKVTEIKKTLTNNFNKINFSQINYKENETKNIYYFEQLCYLKYPKSHLQFSNSEGYKPVENFNKFNDKMDLDNSEDYLFSNAYKQIVLTLFEDKIVALNHGDDENTARVAIPEIQKLKSECIKNALYQNLIYEMRPGNPNLEFIYQNLMQLSTNERFKELVVIKYNKFEKLQAGKPSPGFNLENKNGGFTTLEELKGKYVYIDVWATWCRPCREEIPHLQKIEEEFHGKNIVFVSISVDKRESLDKWKKLINDKNLGGIQLISENAWSTEFVKSYAIDNIPRFILVDDKGNIISADAPRPSSEKLKELLNTLPL